MPQFHKPRLFSAILSALLCINYSFASPVSIRARSPLDIVSAYEPVHIIPAEDLPPDYSPPKGHPTTTNDGTTLTTTFNNRRDIVRNEQNRSALAVTEPLNINRVTEPVNIIPIDQAPPQLRGHGGGITRVTNDGTTITTTFGSDKRTTNETASLDLVNPANRTLAGVSELELGLNCQGSAVMCIGATQTGVMHTLRDYMYAIPHGYRYYAGQNIACMKHHVYPNPWITWGFYCAFMQGNISKDGEDGAEIQLKMQQMIEHHCLGCGSVPFSEDNDPNTLGILTVNYVRQSECEGLCYYVPPGESPSSVKVPQGMVLVQ